MTQAATKNQLPNIVIKSEEDAYAVLDRAAKGQLEPYGQIVFDGWPTLQLYLKGEKFDQSITPTVMRGLLEFQRGLYRSYAVAKYDNPTKRLSDEEKTALEVRVDVGKGSSDFGINFQDLAIELVKQLGGKMDPTHVLIAVVSIAVMYFGSSSVKAYLEHRKDVRAKEVSDETQRKTLEALQFTSAQETERMKIMAEVIKASPRVENITRLAYDAQTELVKSMAAGDEAKLAGVQVDPEIADALTRNARRKGTEVRLDGMYRLLKLDWSGETKLRVKIYNVNTGVVLDADVQDDSLDGRHKAAIREAEWARNPVQLRVNAKLFGDDDYREVTVLSAAPVPKAV